MTPVTSPPPSALAYGLLVAQKAAQIAKGDLRAERIDQREVEHATEQLVQWLAGEDRQLLPSNPGPDSALFASISDLRRLLQGSEEAVETAIHQLGKTLDYDPQPSTSRGFVETIMAGDVAVLAADRRTTPDLSIAGQLGEASGSPLTSVDDLLLRALTGHPLRRWIRALSGIHLSVGRTHTGLPYTHHGIYLGDGSVVHFIGEPGASQRENQVQRDRISAFRKEAPIDKICLRSLKRQSGERIAHLDPAVTCVRALARVGDSGYKLAQDNCEHLATWAQYGYGASFQVEQVQQFVSLSTSAARRAAKVLGKQLTLGEDECEDQIAQIGVIGDGLDSLYPIDIARAYWDSDRADFFTWFPLWDAASEAIVGERRNWTIGLPDESSHWLHDCPSPSLDPSWHASLVSLAGKSCYWITSDGRWFKSTVDVTEVTERRLDPARAVFESLTSKPSRGLQKLADIVA